MPWMMFAIIRIIRTKFRKFPYGFIFSFVYDTTSPAYPTHLPKNFASCGNI